MKKNSVWYSNYTHVGLLKYAIKKRENFPPQLPFKNAWSAVYHSSSEFRRLYCAYGELHALSSIRGESVGP